MPSGRYRYIRLSFAKRGYNKVIEFQLEISGSNSALELRDVKIDCSEEINCVSDRRLYPGGLFEVSNRLL
jgi:hypothetical protein